MDNDKLSRCETCGQDISGAREIDERTFDRAMAEVEAQRERNEALEKALHAIIGAWGLPVRDEDGTRRLTVGDELMGAIREARGLLLTRGGRGAMSETLESRLADAVSRYVKWWNEEIHPQLADSYASGLEGNAIIHALKDAARAESAQTIVGLEAEVERLMDLLRDAILERNHAEARLTEMREYINGVEDEKVSRAVLLCLLATAEGAKE